MLPTSDSIANESTSRASLRSVRRFDGEYEILKALAASRRTRYKATLRRVYFICRASRGLITAAHYPNCRHLVARARAPSSSYARLSATPFARQRGRKFMGFLHEITRKHNPCPLRRMSPRPPAALFLSPSCTARLSSSSSSKLFPSLKRISLSPLVPVSSSRFIPRASAPSDRSRNLPAVLLRNLICIRFPPSVLAAACTHRES